MSHLRGIFGETMDRILEMQKDLQSKLHVKNQAIKSIENISTLGEKCDALMYNKNAFDYEFKEVLEALSASEDPSSLWKNWKQKYNETRSKLYTDLTDSQKRELQMEFVDMGFIRQIVQRQLFGVVTIHISDHLGDVLRDMHAVSVCPSTDHQ